ncbi:oligodendrocyte transcription factor 1 [Astyanax mexicanus]|uniref:Oligodendrocyte transcription factor 1 n=1 Tax=Astyanax mexicanus TaxID=7994 RepID=A0A8T2LN08_ASTMX|nr:oligodendrocyte transcription factor 1 [Astyanax mexicanus]
MHPASSLKVSEQDEESLQQLMPRSVRVGSVATAVGGSLSDLGGFQGPQRHPKLPRELSLEEQQDLRRKINSRERKRMQDLNLAMDALREVMVPYSSSPSSSPPGAGGVGPQHPYLPHGPPPNGRRLSKISTLVLARNYILLLGSSLQEMRRLLGEVSIGMGVGGTVPRVLLAGGWPVLTGPGQLLLTPPEVQPLSAVKCSPLPVNDPSTLGESWSSAGVVGTTLCPCGVCRAPRVMHGPPTSRFQK